MQQARRSLWTALRQYATPGLQFAWRAVRTGWFFALLFFVVAVDRSIQLRAQKRATYDLAVHASAAASENLFNMERLAAPRPIHTVEDLRWYFETVEGSKRLESRLIVWDKRQEFLDNLQPVHDPLGQQRLFTTWYAEGSVCDVRIVDAVELRFTVQTNREHAPPAE